MASVMTLLEPQASAETRSVSLEPTKARPFWTTTFPALVVFVASVLFAIIVYSQFLGQARQLWWSTLHDRNAHYSFGQHLVLDLRTGNLRELVHHLDIGSRMWGPLHGVLMAPVLAIGGIDFRLGVIPSLLAWIGTAVFGFLIARRAAPRGGNFAGFVTALFILASPAHGAYATDTMLESLGACLTLLVIYAYLLTQQEVGRRSGRILGISLTLLFFHKYNYWLLIVLGLGAAELLSRPAQYRDALLGILKAVDWRAWLRGQIRNPLTYCIAVVLGLLLIQAYGNADTISILGWRVSFQTPHNLITVAYALLLVRLLPWWFRSGRHRIQRQDLRVRQVFFWHALPVALWFLVPKRLGYFLSFVGPGNQGEQPSAMFPGGWLTYWQYFVEDYHVGLWSALLVVGSIALLIALRVRLRPGGVLIACFLVIAVLLTVHHPNRKARFLHSWMGVAWVAAGLGLARFGTGWHALSPRRAWAHRETVGHALRFAQGVPPSALVLGILIALHARGLLHARRAQEGGLRPEAACALELTDCYLPALADAKQPLVLSNRPLKFLTSWAYQEHHGRFGRLETDIRGFGPSAESNRASFQRWLATTQCDAVVFIDLPVSNRFHEGFPFPTYDEFPKWMTDQTVFAAAERWTFPHLGGGTVTLWKRFREGEAPVEP